jgi:hypothetical protein
MGETHENMPFPDQAHSIYPQNPPFDLKNDSIRKKSIPKEIIC